MESKPAHSIVDATVVHRRLRPRDNAFRYRVAYLCLRLDEFESAAGRWLKLDRRGLVSFRRADHGARDGSDLKAWLKRVLTEHGLGNICDGDIVLMTLPRMLGYVFNPVSFWFCRDRSGALRAVLCEVNNTFGESHCYLVHHDDRRPIEPDAWLEGRKVFHVSPFLPVEGGYRFRFRLDDGRAHVDVNYHDAQGLMLATSVGGRREALSDASVLRRFIGNPTMTLAVIARIHWQALHLFCKRARFHRKPAPPAELVTLFSCMTIAARFVLKALERLSVGRLILHLPDGTTHRFGREGATPQAELHVRDQRFFRRVLLDGDIGFAEAYMEGLCDSPDLPGLIALLADNEKSLGRIAHTNPLHDLALKFLHWQRRNSRKGSRKNIHAHYDLGNDFYRLWLDPTMTYSSALYEGTDGQPLEAAQTAKYERILEQIGAKQGDSILEIGCGWGGFAETAARRGMRVTGVTISQQQLEYARARLERAGLSDRVDLQFRDYRDMEGSYDHIVSIEMIEAVGERYWPDYFAALKRHVVPGGSVLVQAIVIADDFFESYRRHPDFIQTYVFPGGMLLSPTSLREQCRQAGLKVAELYSFGRDYARTLETWLGRFDRVADQVAKMGFDERFRRMWRYYLAYCAAGFSTGRTDVLQAHFRHI